jgi:hypothetical protein
MSADRSASRAFTAAEAFGASGHQLYRCNECFALLLAEDARSHLWWHDTILSTKEGEA